jgi:hypothetical protein
LVCGLGGAAGAAGVERGFDLDLAGERGECGVLELVVVKEVEVETGKVGVVVWRVLASWQSASAGRKRLMAM